MPLLNILDVILPSLVLEKNMEAEIEHILDNFDQISEFEVSDGEVTYILNDDGTFFISIDTDRHSVVMQIEWNDETKVYVHDLFEELLE